MAVVSGSDRFGTGVSLSVTCRRALNNGVSPEEIRAIIHVIGIYCGVPQALECFRVAKRVLEVSET
ncbi:MAG: carboxymuconolactone decarboxylase family protein [Hyphomicrobiales bacterium]|nr:carboxymuconolactone decarboxylase family protein [Hyphomicrobiales bacterium]